MNAKRLINVFLSCIFCASFSWVLISCDSEKGDGGNSFEPSAALKEAFKSDFPTATDASWSSYDGYAIVSFNMAAKSSTASNVAWYTNTASPELVQTQEKLGADQGMLPASLPDAVKEAFNQTIYNDPAKWRLDEVEIHNRYYVHGYNGSEKIYKIEMEAIRQGLYDVDLYFDENGVLLKECMDYDDDRDHDWDDNDIPISSELMKRYSAAATEKYPDYEIDEIERISTRIQEYPVLILVEMESRTGNGDQEIDVFFQTDASWLATSFEIPYSQLPQAVSSAIQKDYAGWEMDDVNRWETSISENALLYSVGMEKEEGNNDLEKIVFFKETGEVVRVVNIFD